MELWITQKTLTGENKQLYVPSENDPTNTWQKCGEEWISQHKDVYLYIDIIDDTSDPRMPRYETVIIMRLGDRCVRQAFDTRMINNNDVKFGYRVLDALYEKLKG